MRFPATETAEETPVSRERLLLLAKAKAKAARERAEADSADEDAGSFAGGVGAFGVGAAKQIPILGSNIEELAANMAANRNFGDPLRGDLGYIDPDEVKALAEKYRGMTSAVRQKYPLSYGAGAASSIGAQFMVPGTLLAKVPRAMRLLAAPAVGGASAYLERPEGAESMTPEQEQAARISQAKWGAGIAGGLHGLSELPTALKFGKKAARAAYDFIEPGGIPELKDVLMRKKEQIGEAVLPLLKGMRRSSKKNLEEVARRAGDVAKDTGEKIGKNIDIISEAHGTGIPPTELTARTSNQVKAPGVPGDPTAIPEAAEFAGLEKGVLDSLGKVLKLGPKDQEQIAQRVKKGVAAAREEIEKTRPATAKELAYITERELRKWTLAYGKVSPKAIQNVKSQAHDRIAAEFSKDKSTRNMSAPLIRYYEAQANAAKGLIGEAAEKISPKMRDELDDQMRRYSGAVKIKSYAAKKAAKKAKALNPWDIIKPAAAGAAAIGAIGGGESSQDPDMRDLGYLTGLPLGLAAVMLSPENPALRARVLSRLSKIKADPLKFGLIGGALGGNVTPGTSTPDGE